MGIGGISIWQLVIILVIVIMLFGTKRLRGLGGDLGSAVKGFKKAISDEPNKDDEKPEEQKLDDDSQPSEEKKVDAEKSEQTK